MTAHRLGIALAVVAAGGLAVGCGGGSCPTETPRIDKIQSCTVQPGQTVNLQLQLCPTCNLSNISCDVDTSNAASAGVIQLDPVAQRCESSASCPSPSCVAPNAAVCTFTAPTVPGSYTVRAFDPASNSFREGTLDVGGALACSF
jgi:hypothetical protein